jgi:hypothetical protein
VIRIVIPNAKRSAGGGTFFELQSFPEVGISARNPSCV